MVKVRGLSFAYGKGGNKVLNQLSFDLEAGSCTAILGNNGAGKSTLLKCLVGIHKAHQGSVTIAGYPMAAMSRNSLAQHVAYLPQQVRGSGMRVFDAVLLGRKPYIQWEATSQDKQIVEDVMARMQISQLALRPLSSLSGGEQQKVMLARALAQQPKLLLLDEPTSNLDPFNQHEGLRLVKQIARAHGIAVAIVIHDLNLAARYCDRYIFLLENRVLAAGGAETLTADNIRAAYGMEVALLSHQGIPLILPLPDQAGQCDSGEDDKASPERHTWQ